MIGSEWVNFVELVKLTVGGSNGHVVHCEPSHGASHVTLGIKLVHVTLAHDDVVDSVRFLLLEPGLVIDETLVCQNFVEPGVVSG